MTKKPMTKKLETLPQDVYSLFDPKEDHKVDERNVEVLLQNIGDLVRSRLLKQEQRDDPLRFSALGKPNRQMWYEAHPLEGSKEEMLPKTYLKFMYGAIIEELLLFLVKEAGHEVSDEQREVDVDGVKGHIDAIIDGVVVDVKSASPYGFKKFKDRTIFEDDAFGYIDQLSGYANVLTPGKAAAWVAFDKVAGDICVTDLVPVVIDHHQPAERITELRKVIASEEPPERCYEPVADGKSGNLKLPTPCSYCHHKYRCHPDLRTFLYSTGPRFLTTVVREPDVPEAKGIVIEEA